jgi:hypothetical protein
MVIVPPFPACGLTPRFDALIIVALPARRGSREGRHRTPGGPLVLLLARRVATSLTSPRWKRRPAYIGFHRHELMKFIIK